MRPRLAVGCALVLAAAAPGFAQDWYEPNPSLARLSADDAYARTSAQSLRTAGIDAAVAIRLDVAGRVLVADETWDAQRIVRLDADGRLDPTFGAAGVAEVPVGGTPVGLEVDAAGRIVVTGSFFEAGAYGYLPGYDGPVYGAARLLADGSLDPAFSGDGLLDLDRAPGLYGLGQVRASGGDGAMLAVAAKPGPDYDTPVGPRHDTLVGLVRITADGTLDATYGSSGFAQIAEVSPFPPFSTISTDVRVADFAIDSAGRAFVAVQDRDGSGTVQRLDTAGVLDLPFWSGFQSQVELDGAGRIVGFRGGRLLRRLSDGAPDPTFGGDGFAWNNAAGFLGPAWSDIGVVCYDQEREGVPCDGEFLAVATRADRWALAKLVDYRNAKGRVVRGIEVQAIDPADPGAIVSTRYRPPDRSFGKVVGLAIAPDGTAAYALSSTFVLRVDLTSAKPAPLPDLSVRWVGYPRAVDLGGGRYRVTANVRIRNASRREVAAAWGLVGFAPGSYDIPLVDGPHFAISGQSVVGYGFRVRGRASVVQRFTWEGGDSSMDLAGARLSIQVACELPDANFADNTATSLPITPLWAPR